MDGETETNRIKLFQCGWKPENLVVMLIQDIFSPKLFYPATKTYFVPTQPFHTLLSWVLSWRITLQPRLDPA